METDISYADFSNNEWWGCTRVEGSPACEPCYAAQIANHFYPSLGLWDGGPVRPATEAYRCRAFAWNRKAQREGRIMRVLSMSMGDWAEGRTEQKALLDKLWPRIEQTEMLAWMMLTKRPQLISKLMPEHIRKLARVWQGTTTENQRWLDLRWEHLKRIEAAVYWLSVEPMVEPIILPADFLALGSRAWVVCGGMSGKLHKQYPLDPDWARHLRDQCLEHGVRFHMKQMSGYHPHDCDIPGDLRIRQYPQGHPDTAFADENKPALPILHD